MNDKTALEVRIQILRTILYTLIENRNDLLDPDIIDISRELDLLINEYFEEKFIKLSK